MTLFGELLAVLSLIIVSIVSFFSLRNMNRYNSTFDSLKNLVGRDEEGHLVMDERLVKVIDAVGSRMFQSAKMSMLQGLSVDAKLDKGLEEALAKDIIEDKLPLLDAGAGLLKEFTGYNVKKYIAKNPRALIQLLGNPQVQGFLKNFAGGGILQSNNPGNRGRM